LGAAGGIRHEDARRLLPALRGCHGAHAPLSRHSRPGRSRFRRRHPRPGPGPLECQRSRGACLGRGLVQGLRLAAVRPDAGRAWRGAIFRWEFGVDPEAFVGAATAARFGPAEGTAVAALTAKRELRALLEIARRSLTWRERARGLLSLRSLARPVAVDPTAPAGSP